MAKGDLAQSTVLDQNVGTTTTTVFGSAPAEDNMIILIATAQRGSADVTTDPTGFTRIHDTGTTWPQIIVFAKIAVAAEGNSYAVVWDHTSPSGNTFGYDIEGPFTGNVEDNMVENSASTGSAVTTLGSGTVSPSGACTLVGGAVHVYGTETATHTTWTGDLVDADEDEDSSSIAPLANNTLAACASETGLGSGSYSTTMGLDTGDAQMAVVILAIDVGAAASAPGIEVIRTIAGVTH